MDPRILKSLAIWVLLTVILWGLGLLIAWGDYALNKPLIDIIKFVQFEWWYCFTYRHWWAWLYVNDLGDYLIYSFIICAAITIVIALVWYGREWD
ncbi:MAG: hypothetical protein ACTSRG_20660 [Candidatus Helarchaeota archaeon]